MTASKPKTNIMYIPGKNPYADRGNTGFLVTNIDIGFAKEPFTGEDGEAYTGAKHEVYWPRPRVEDHAGDLESLEAECKEFFGEACDLQAIVDAAIGQFMVRPNYKTFVEDALKLNPDASAEVRHAAAQTAASGYQVGVKRTASASTKKKAAAFDALEREAQEAGLTMEEIIAKIRAGEVG